MNNITHTPELAAITELSATTDATFSQGVSLQNTWPFNPAGWHQLVQPIYSAMDRQARFTAGAPLRAKARSAEGLSAAEHLLYALLKGKSPFKAFSPYKAGKPRAAGEAAWHGLLQACNDVYYRWLPEMEISPELRTQLQQLLVVTRYRASGLSMKAFERRYPDAFRLYLRSTMATAPQGSSSVMKHCVQTREAFDRLACHLETQEPLALPVPAWVQSYREPLARLAAENRSLMQEYLGWHDCGKPFCLAYDEQGRPHFPGHATVSALVWLEGGGCAHAASLMAQDMDLHTLKAEDCEEFARRPDAGLLLLAGVASLHANAQDFGGAESESFKIKFKRLSARGQRICETLFPTT